MHYLLVACYLKVLYERICMVIAVASNMNRSLKSQNSATKTAQYSNVIHTILTDMILILSGIDL